MTRKKDKTIVGEIHPEVLEYTAGKDVELDRALIEADCYGSAAHVTMLSRMPVKPPVISPAELKKVLKQLRRILVSAEKGTFKISLKDQDVHLAVERHLTEALGDLGKKVHTGRSRNDQIALDLRLYAREQLLGAIEETTELARALLALAKRFEKWPMAGRTHMQPAMPSSVGLWASAHAEALFDDIAQLIGAYELNDQSPLGSAAGYGVPLPIDRALVARLLGFSRCAHNVLYASNARGRIEIVLLNAMSQVMLSLGRLAQDLMLYTLPEFNYFSLPAEYGTGSSIMPQKNNPDVLELVRARVSRVHAQAVGVFGVVNGLPSGYNRDLQEAKEPFMEGIDATRSSVRVMTLLAEGLIPNRKALLAGFSPGVFATDRAIELVGQGVPFRDAYDQVKNSIDELAGIDPHDHRPQRRHRRHCSSPRRCRLR
ncbi:MAG: argininosuccinate lyase, partial [Verrucomicrobiota bacterium]